MKKLALFLSLVVLASPLDAQQQQANTGYATGITGLTFVSPMQISAGKDNNFIIDRSLPGERLFFLSLSPSVQRYAKDALPKQFDDQVLLIGMPTVAYISDSSRREFAATYQPEFEIFRFNDDQNSTNHLATAEFRYDLTRRTQLYVSDGYRNSNDPSRTLQNVFLLLPRGSYKENSFRSSVNYDKSDLTSFAVRFDHTITVFGLVDQFQRRILDTTGTAVSLIATRMVARNHRMRGTYSLFQARPINQQREGDDQVDQEVLSPSHSLNLEYRFSPNLGMVFELAGGLVNSYSGTNYIFGGSVDKRFGTMWLGGGYSRSLSFFATGPRALPNGISPTSFYEVVYFRFRGEPARRVGLNLTGVGSRMVDSALVEDSQAALGRARLDYRLSERLVTFITAETYQQNRNEFVNAPVSRNRLFAGIEFSLSSESSQRTSRLNRDTDNVGFNEQDRRRQQPK